MKYVLNTVKELIILSGMYFFINLGLSVEAARAEAKRCLECGCHDYFDCKLIRYANLLRTDTKRLKGAYHPGFV